MDRLEQVIAELREFVAERDWQQYHDPKNLAMALVSEAGELAAEYRWIANDVADEWSQDSEHRERVTMEAADVGIALLLFCDRLGVDIVSAMKAKVDLNRRNYPVDVSRGRPSRPVPNR